MIWNFDKEQDDKSVVLTRKVIAELGAKMSGLLRVAEVPQVSAEDCIDQGQQGPLAVAIKSVHPTISHLSNSNQIL
jgi:hypothetical protein